MENMIDDFNPLLNESFVFRPFNSSRGDGIVATPGGYSHERHGVLRYADGRWIPDDGECDLAFVHSVFATGVHLPDYGNAIWSWIDMDLTKSWIPERLHKYAKWFHSYNINNTPFDQKYHWDNNQHPNKIAMKSAMDKTCSLHGVANGRGAFITSEGKHDESWLAEKRILIKSTMKPVLIPENPICYLCLDNGKGHLIEALKEYKERLESDIEYASEEISKSQSNIYDNQDIVESATEMIPKLIDELRDLGIASELIED